MYKVGVFNGETDILKDPIKGRPFSFNLDQIEITENYEDCDYILGYLDLDNCNSDYKRIRKSSEFKRFKNKFVFYAMHDNPKFAYLDREPIKFICQPIYYPRVNKEFNIISVPLQMRHFEMELIRDQEFIDNCRHQKKIYDFIFIGNINPKVTPRSWLQTINLDNYYLKETKPIWHVQSVEERVEMVKDFCMELSKAKFCFAPRGVGSTSFRLYQSLMVGTVPIISGMMDYPFRELVCWKDFSISTGLGPYFPYESLVENEDRYSQMRLNGIQFWEKYVRLNNSDQILFDHYLSNNKSSDIK